MQKNYVPVYIGDIIVCVSMPCSAACLRKSGYYRDKLCKVYFKDRKQMAKRRFDEIDVMRIIGFLMVVDQHILGAYAQRADTGFAASLVLHFFYLLGRPAVPMFVAITGFTLLYSNYGRFDMGRFYRKRFAAVVFPYIFWSFATIVIFKKYYLLRDIIEVLATGSASYHLWYMGMLTRLYLWLPVILAMITRVMKRSSNTKKALFILCFILYWAVLKENSNITGSLTVLIFGNASVYGRKFIQYSPVYWSIYFLCGAAVYFRYEYFKKAVLKRRKVIFIAYIPLTAYMYYTQVCKNLPAYFPRIAYEYLFYILFMLLTAAVVYVISVKAVEKAGRFKGFVSELGALSYGAYLIHVIILQKLAPVLRRELPGADNLTAGILIFIAVSILSFAICRVIRLLPLAEYIIGAGRKPVSLAKDKTYSVT